MNQAAKLLAFSFWLMVDISSNVRFLATISFLQRWILALRGCDMSAECRVDSGNSNLRRRKWCCRIAGVKSEIGLRWVIAGSCVVFSIEFGVELIDEDWLCRCGTREQVGWIRWISSQSSSNVVQGYDLTAIECSSKYQYRMNPRVF